jgi:hypothetical protein
MLTLINRITRFFKLPPVEKRQMVEGNIREIFFPNLRKEEDDTYIYYLIMTRSFIVAAMFAMLYWISFTYSTTFDLFVFEINVDHADPVRSMAQSYSFVVSTALLLIFLPYGWLLFRVNIDLGACDLVRWNRVMREKTGMERHKLMKQYLLGILLLLTIMYTAFCVPKLILSYKVWQQLKYAKVFFISLLIFYTWLFSSATSAIVMCGATFFQHWRRIGPQYRAK